MPVIDDIHVEPGIEEIARRGMGNAALSRTRVAGLLREVLEEVGAEGLLRPRAAYGEHRVEGIIEGGFRLQGDVVIRGGWLPDILPRARSLVAAACTIGPALERRSSLYFRQGEQLKGFLLDIVGSAAVDLLAAEVCRRIKEDLGPGTGVSSPLSPGAGGLPLSLQADLLALAGAERIGLRITSGGMLDPRKSLTMLLGTGEGMPRWTPEEACARCPMAAECPYRLREEVP